MFVRGGWVEQGRALEYSGHGGDYWSSMIINEYVAYNLYFDSWDIEPAMSDLVLRYNGVSVRCVALGGSA